MRIIALTGVPGTGKTTIADALARRGLGVVDLNAFARAKGLLREKDHARGSFIIDMDELADTLHHALATLDDDAVILEGHFAHDMDADAIALLRCDPLVLLERLRARGWPPSKIRENVEAEALDVLAQEVLDTGIPAIELDVTHAGVEEAADKVEAIAEGPLKGLKGRRVGSAHWSLERLPWF